MRRLPGTALIVLAGLSSAVAQERDHVRLGVLATSSEARLRGLIAPGFEKIGLIEGRNLVLDIRAGRSEELPRLARELVAARPRAIIASGAAAISAASNATETIPPQFARDAARLAQLALEARLPTTCEWREMAEEGCFVSYGPSIASLWGRAADYVDRILKGGSPGEMPIEQPTRFELVINLKTAKALGLTVPPSLLARADEVIE